MKRLLIVLIAVLVVPAVCSAQTTYKATLTWVDLSTNEDGFKIERCTKAATDPICTNQVPFAVVGQVAADVVSFVDQPIGAGMSHCWRVKAFNAAGDSLPSPTACATAPSAPTVPAAPGTLQVVITIAP